MAMMKEGGAGIDEYTAAVTDSGYAAEVAAKKMDNLGGDAASIRDLWWCTRCETIRSENLTYLDSDGIRHDEVCCYEVVPGPSCRSCRHWRPDDGGPTGDCAVIVWGGDRPADPWLKPGLLTTREDFGCVLHEPAPADPEEAPT